MKTKHYKIVFACNDNFFDGLYLSVLSITRRCKNPIDFYVLSADYTELNTNFKTISNKKIKILDTLVKKYCKDSSVKLIDCTKQAKKYLNGPNINRKMYSPYCNLRLLLHLFDELDGYVLYLDTDIMACGDVKAFFDIDLKNNEIAVSHNWCFKTTFYKNYFNAGVILYNMPVVRKNNFLNKAISIFNKKYMFFGDQTALSRAVSKKMYFPEDEFRFNRQSKKNKPNDIIIHFCRKPHAHNILANIKQWEVDKVHKHLKIFIFDDDYAIWQKEKVKWQK